MGIAISETVVVLNATEARALVARVHGHLAEARAALLELYERDGWKPLGYPSWQACIDAEFGQARNTLWYQLEAARAERELQAVQNFEQHLPDMLLRQIAALPAAERAEIAHALARDHLTIKALRRLILEKKIALPRNGMDMTAIDDGARPISETADWRVDEGDARHLPFDDGEVQLIVTSPPYNARIHYANYVDWLPWDDYWFGLIGQALLEAYRVLCPGGRLCLNLPNVVRQDVGAGAWAPEDVSYRQLHGQKWSPPGAKGRPWSALVEAHLYPLAAEIGFLPRERIQWVKGPEEERHETVPSTAWGTWGSAVNPVLRAMGEPVYVFSKERFDRPDIGQDDISEAEFLRDTRNVWFVPAVGVDPTVFPATFPVELPRRLIRLYSFVGDLVVDPFCGSGTTLVAARESGRRAYGCDVDPWAVHVARTALA